MRCNRYVLDVQKLEFDWSYNPYIAPCFFPPSSCSRTRKRRLQAYDFRTFKGQGKGKEGPVRAGGATGIQLSLPRIVRLPLNGSHDSLHTRPANDDARPSRPPDCPSVARRQRQDGFESPSMTRNRFSLSLVLLSIVPRRQASQSTNTPAERARTCFDRRRRPPPPSPTRPSADARAHKGRQGTR